ncbi:S46 family peptidase [Bowmanella sp. JS7-9]|uniref:Dipeptidyl-peptidase n=1 Tax=Pseudobowmanella zhangzhouensis TaxID=1537679 RepID=A0ABW1XKI6_9ALTE|nr:S46 family peptidase [Bowmanella sp. JS7-9]TBX22489.1 dipeptidyl-peptidase 7 [Bowmanella sp. JS7-9]
MKKLILALPLLLAGGMAQADEGMWQPHQLKQLAKELKAKGLKLDPNKMQNLDQFPMNAIISLGGCTASFVSPQGLVVTNHHCAYGSIQYNSTEENNLLEKGFVAKSLDKELPAAPGSRVYVTESLTNVTDQITGSLDKNLSGDAFYAAVEMNEKRLVAECETNPDYRCSVYSFHGGLEYYLIKQLAIRDVRLVYAPPSSIGKFGGDTDNWMWPRHTGDWSFYRAYVNKDGRPADFSADNVPFEPKAFLKVNADSVQENDFVMVLGYPGRTNRYRTSDEVENNFTWSYPTAKAYREKYIDIIKSVAPKGSDARIKYESTIAGLANYAKNYGSMVESFNKGNMLERKVKMEQDLQAWINASAERKAKYGDAINTLEALIAKGDEHKERDMLLSYLGRNSMMSVSRSLLRLAHEMQKPDAERDQGLQERDMPRMKQGLISVNRRYDAEVDKAVILYFMSEYAKLPASEHVAALDKFFGIENGFDEAKVKAKLDMMHANTQLDEEAVRLAWMNKSVDEFKASDDPYIQFAVAMYEFDKAERDAGKALYGELQRARPAYMQAVIDYKNSLGQPVYADANSSLRISYGSVKGYSPQDGLVATPFTTLEGILAKYIPGDEEFDMPAKQRELIMAKEYGPYKDKKLGTVPVNFLSTLDITGGNSGSPALNGKGELVGLLFDGVYESIIGDWDYDDDYNRSISVSTAYMLWVMQYVDGADNLIKEMQVIRSK